MRMTCKIKADNEYYTKMDNYMDLGGLKFKPKLKKILTQKERVLLAHPFWLLDCEVASWM